MTVVAHPRKESAELNLRIREAFTGHGCWKAECLLEDLLVLEFGERRTFEGNNGPLTLGKLRVSVQVAPWFIERDGKIVLLSEDVEEGISSPLDDLLMGKELQRIDWARHCSLIFTDGIILKCDRDGGYEGDCTYIVELRFDFDAYVDCLADGTIAFEESPEA